ncbi:synaptic vesicle glycoprotein [Thraustotheca clavata]|uniref:Synaptic vesicle glycoprotein n=1 Tax=Thraustotheca clavata TaxID=74557 RepID=A0A1V9Y7L6_9STRA|nr:synaptic vesicle glycoprotein [Thraustotheca clavata]
MPELTSPRSTKRLEAKQCAKELVEQEIELLGCGRFHVRMACVLGLGNAADAVEILSMGYILGAYTEPMTGWESSLVSSAVFVGMLIGGVAGTILGDQYGRRVLMLASLALNGCSGLCAAVSPGLVWMVFFRCLAGIGIGGIAPMLFAVCLEHVPQSARGKYITIISAFWMVGSIFTACLAWVMLGTYWGSTERILNVSWRTFSATASIPAFLSCFLVYAYVPESPRYLVAKGRLKEASETLAYIYAVNGSSRMPNFTGPDDDRISIEQFNASQQQQKRRDSLTWYDRWTVLLTSPAPATSFDLRFTTMLLLVSTFCLSFGSYGISTWITRVFQSTNVSNPYANDILYASAALPGNIIGLYLVDWWGRRPLFSASLFLSAGCGLVFSLNSSAHEGIIVAICCLFQAGTTMAWIGYDVMSAEVYPLNMRVSALCFLSSTGRLGATFAQLVNGLLMGPPAHISALLFVTTAIMAVGGTAVLFLPETEFFDEPDDLPHRNNESQPLLNA